MRFRSILLLAGALVVGACSSAPVRLYPGPQRPAAEVAVLSLPEPIEIAQINGVEVPAASGMNSKGDKVLELEPGRYDVLAYYRELWVRGDNHEVLRSNPVRLLVEARPGQRYRFEYPRPQTFAQAEALSLAFRGWAVEQASGLRIETEYSGMAFRGGLLAQIQGDRSLVQAVTKDGGQQVVKPLDAGEPAPPLASPAAPAAAAAAPIPDDQQLLLVKGWWNQATPEQRRAFLEWVAAQR